MRETFFLPQRAISDDFALKLKPSFPQDQIDLFVLFLFENSSEPKANIANGCFSNDRLLTTSGLEGLQGYGFFSFDQ